MTATTVFKAVTPGGELAPVVVSIPHCGTLFPADLSEQFEPKLVQAPDDTDWFVDQLYDFAPAMGITMVSAVYSRWVIDLNRDPESKPLYTDGRIITGLCPITTFLGEPLYKDKRKEVGKAEVDRRLQHYYHPYHQKITDVLNQLKSKFAKVLLWDCHSIRQVVSTIQKDKFPDLILGSADQTSADTTLVDVAVKNLRTSPYSFQHNHPFKGGYITRHFGQPAQHQHALQLEMSKVNYMDDAELAYDKARADKMRELLKRTLGNLTEQLSR